MKIVSKVKAFWRRLVWIRLVRISDLMETVIGIIVILVAFGLVFLYEGKIVKEHQNQLKAIQEEADEKVEKAKKEVEQANSKFEALEKKNQQEYNDKVYELIESYYVVCQRLDKENVDRNLVNQIVQKCMLIDLNVPEMPGYMRDSEITDEKILEYITTMEQIAEKYPLSYDANTKIILRLDDIESNFKDEIQSVEIFEKIWQLEEKCAQNKSLWEEKLK